MFRLVLPALLLSPGLLRASELSPGTLDPPRRPRIGLALSGGGARGLAEVGVLRALEEAGIPIDCIAGTSMGAVIGGLYAAGVSVDSLESIGREAALFEPPTSYHNLDVYQKRLLRPRTFGLYFSGWEYRLPRSLVNDFNINWMLVEHATPAYLHARGDFDRLPIPFRALALDLRSGETVIFHRGDLARAIRSSMSVPLAFPPIPMRNPDRLLIDAGSRNNLPVDILKSMGCERIIAVNCTSREEERLVRDDAGGIALDLVRILSSRTDSLSVEGWDVWIEPRLGGIRLMEFDRHDEAYELGYRAAQSQMDKVRALLPPGYAAPPPARPGIRDLERAIGPLKVAYVRLAGRPGSYAWVPKSELKMVPGGPFSMELLGKGLRRLYATNHYEAIWPNLALVDSSRVGITLELEERSRTYLSVGLLYDNSRMANLDFEILRDNVLRLGETVHGSFMVGSFYDGVETGVRSSHLRGVPFGMDLLLRTDRTRYRQTRSGDFERRSRLVMLGTAVSAGRNGLLWARAGIRREIGNRGIGVEDWDHTERILSGTILLDGTDERVLPSRGARMRLRDEVHIGPGRPVHELGASLSFSMSRSVFLLSPELEAQGLSREGLPFRHWHRVDLSRATLGMFERGLYAPFTGRLSLTAGLRLAENLHLWSTGTMGFRGETWDAMRDTRGERGLDLGLLQRTPAGPVMLSGSWEKGRPASLLIQVGHDLWDEP